MGNTNVSIVTYNTSERDLNRCVASLRLCNAVDKIFVIDNSPTSRLKRIIEDLSCQYFHDPQNTGYGAGHNLAIKISLSQEKAYHLVINADVYFEYPLVDSCVKFLSENANAGMVMPKILNPDGSNQKLAKFVPTPFDLLVRLFLPKYIRERMGSRLLIDRYDPSCPTFVPYLSGCFMLLRTQVLKSTGLFDERFFMYPEDIDLTRRIAVAHDTIYLPTEFAYHSYGGASKKSLKMLWVHAINMIKYFNKWGWLKDDLRTQLNTKTERLLTEN